jgi:hypothetical protein
MRWGHLVTACGIVLLILQQGLPVALNIIGVPGTVADANTWQTEWLPPLLSKLELLENWVRDQTPVILIIVGLTWAYSGVFGIARDWGRVKFLGPLEIDFPYEANLPHKMAEPYKKYDAITTIEDRTIGIYRAVLCLAVKNRSRITVDNVRLQIVCGGRPLQPINAFLPTSPPGAPASVDPGGQLFFRLGEYFFTEMHPTVPLLSEPRAAIEKKRKLSEFMALLITPEDMKTTGFIRNSGQLFYAKITARNALPLYATFRLEIEGQHTMLRLIKSSFSEWKPIDDVPKTNPVKRAQRGTEGRSSH